MVESTGKGTGGASDQESSFVSRISAGAEYTRDHRVADILQRVRHRKQVFDDVFASPSLLAAAIERSHSVSNALRGIETAVLDNQPALRHLATTDGAGVVANGDVVSQYYMLATSHYVDPHGVLSHIPPLPSLCELQAAYQHYKYADDAESRQAQLDIAQALSAVQQFLSHRWFILTGGSLGDEPDLSLRRLTARKAPVPWRTAWSRELYGLEAERLGHAACAVEARAMTLSGSPTSAVETEVEAHETSSAGTLSACDIERIYELAGTQPPRVHREGEPRYTFPGRLNTNEDIYYDYAVVLPVDECGPFKEERTDRIRDVDAARVLAGKALQVVTFLEDMQLADALGFRDQVNRANQPVIGDVKHLLADILAVDAAKSAIEVGQTRDRIRQMTGLLREIAQSEMLLAPLQPQAIDDLRVRLEAAINALPLMQRTFDERINHSRSGSEWVSYLAFPDYVHGNVRVWGNGITSGQDGYSLDHNDMVRNLGPYLEYLGGGFFDLVSALKARADEARAMLVAVQQPGTAFRHNFKDLASELVYSAIFALVEILEAAASTLTLLPKERGEGSKRLAMLVVYRQHWFPAGYVQGKLVGYKNLAPNQSEKVLRRTFVKTARETSTVEEFAATRAEEHSQTRRETAEFVKEMSTKFGLSVTASASFDILLASVDTQTHTAFELASNSRSTQSRLAEAAMKTSVSYNEKREVKVSEQLETEDVLEVTTAIENRNQEITANYFYYQLLRDYVVRTELYDLRPVILRARDVPRPATVDARFLSEHAHVLIPALPPQLAVDLQATLGSYDALSRTLIRRRAEATQRRLDLETGRLEPVPTDPELARQRNSRVEILARAASDARAQMHEAEQEYLTSRGRIERVIAHVRANLCFYMQFIWSGSPVVDHQRVLAEETFGGVPLPYLTRGLMRNGFYGNEEMFEFDGTSYALLDVLCRNLKSGEEFLGRGEAAVNASPTFELLAQKFQTGSLQSLVARVREHLFVRDPADAETVLDERSVQLAQDALVVETIPGQVPLLEGFKMAHRMLDVQGKCLENAHLRERIVDRPWQKAGEDSYRVYRREGESAPVVETEPAVTPVP